MENIFMKSKFLNLGIFAVLYLMVGSLAFAAQDENVGQIITIGKQGDACQIKVQGAKFPNSCPTATSQTAYFTCNANEGKEFLSLALAAKISAQPVRIYSTACSIYGVSVANLTVILIE